MVVNSRAVVAVGFGLVGLACLVGPSLAEQDPGVKKASNTTKTAAPKPAPPAPATFGTIDIDVVLKGYDKVKFQQHEFQAAAMVKEKDLLKLKADGDQLVGALQKMTPNSVDARKYEEQITEIKAKLEAGSESARREMQAREVEMLATLYKEISTMTARVAELKGMTYVIQVSNEPMNTSNPNSVMAAMARTVVYADNRNDITKVVIDNLNRNYRAAGGTVPAAATPAAANGGAPPAAATPAGSR